MRNNKIKLEIKKSEFINREKDNLQKLPPSCFESGCTRFFIIEMLVQNAELDFPKKTGEYKKEAVIGSLSDYITDLDEINGIIEYILEKKIITNTLWKKFTRWF